MRDKDRSNHRPVDSRLAPEEEQKLYAEQVKLLCSNIPASSIATLVCSSILIFILWKVISPAALIPWLGCLFLATFLRYLLTLRYKRAPAEPRESARWGVRLIAGIVAVGLVWGSAGVFLFAGGSLAHQLFLIFVLGGLIAGALGSYSVIRWAFPAFAIPASLPIIIHSIIQGGKIEITMGVLELLFVVIMLVVSRRMHVAIVKSLRLQFENIGLIADLTSAKETAEKTGKELRGEITERRRSEERLYKSEEKFRRMVDNITDLVAMSDMNWTFVYASPSYRRILGHDPASLIGLPVHTLVHKDDLPSIMTAIREKTENLEDALAVFRMRHNDGHYLWFETRSRFLLNTEGEPRGVVFNTREVTKRIEAEEEIRERAREFSILNRIIVSASKAEDLSALLENILESTLELLDFDGGGIYLVDECERVAELRCSKGLNPEFLEEIRRVKIDEEPYANIFIRKQSIITDNYQKVSPGHSKRSGLLSLASIPIFSKDRVIGALNAGSKKRHSFTWQERKILQAIGRETGTALARMQAEGAVRKSEKKFQDLYDQAPDMYFSVKPDGTVVSVNRFGAEYLGYGKEELIGKPVWNIVYKDDLKRVQEQVSNILRQKLLESELVFRKVKKDGSVIWVQERARLFFNEDDTSKELRIICRDVTEQKEWEERIAYLSQAVERMGEMVVVTDLNHIVTYANPAVEEILGYKLEEIVGQDSREFFKDIPGNPPDLVQWIKNQETTGIWRGELFNRRSDGAIIKIHLTLSPLKDRSGTLLGYVGVSLDITERERLEAELRHAQKMEAIGTLAGGLAHDFNNILAGIMGYAFLTRKGLPEDSSYIPNMETIENLAQRGSDLTGSLLTLARRGEYRPEPLNIAWLIEEVLNVIKVSLGKDIDFQITLSPDLSNILGDRGQIHQVIMNLCINACEAMPEGGVLAVGSSNSLPDRKFFNRHPGLRKGDYIYLEISDTGVGMDAWTRTRIFDPFFTTKAEKSGTGLGLSVVNGIIEKHDGLILVESEPGRGSIFRIYLPATERPIKREPPVSTEVPGGHETILVVDDEKEVRESTVCWLEDLGYTVFEAEEGEKALGVLEERKDEIDLVLLDMILGEMSGAETFKRMKKIIPALPIIICSGYSLGDDIRRLLQDGTGGFIRKPCVPEELANKIRVVLERKTNEKQ